MADTDKPVGDEPKAKKKKRKARGHKKVKKASAELLTPNEAAVVQARINGATYKEAAVAAGIAPFAQSAYRLEKSALQKASDIFDEEGLSVRDLAKIVKEKTTAKGMQIMHNGGSVLSREEVPDHHLNLRAAEIGLKVHGVLKANVDKVQVEIGFRLDMREVADDDLITILTAGSVGSGTPSRTQEAGRER